MELAEYIQINQPYIYKQTDLFLVLQFHLKPKLARPDLIAMTRYPAETVQTSLARLLSAGILGRETAENGRYLYYLTDAALHFKEDEFDVINYIYHMHPLLMRPNTALLIFILLAKKSFNIDNLLTEGYKKGAVYTSSLKLKAENIIEKSGSNYIFTTDFINKVHAYSQIPVSQTALELFKNEHQKIIRLVANSSSYTGALETLMLVYNLQEEAARELMSLRVSDLVDSSKALTSPS